MGLFRDSRDRRDLSLCTVSPCAICMRDLQIGDLFGLPGGIYSKVKGCSIIRSHITRTARDSLLAALARGYHPAAPREHSALCVLCAVGSRIQQLVGSSR